MDISELQWHVKQEKQELIKAEEKLDYASTINKAGFRNLLTLFWLFLDFQDAASVYFRVHQYKNQSKRLKADIDFNQVCNVK